MPRLLTQGDVIELKPGMKVYAHVPESSVYKDAKNPNALVHHEAVLEEADAGKYIVTYTTKDGGGGGHGDHDDYPNGHHVFCTKVDPPKEYLHSGGFRVDFYQTGAFTAMITDIEPIGKATLVWKIAELY